MIYPFKKPWDIRKKVKYYNIYFFLLKTINFNFFINYNVFNFQFYKNIFKFLNLILIYKFAFNANKYITILRFRNPFYWSLRVRRNWKILSFLKKKKFYLLSNIKLSESNKFIKKYVNIKHLVKTKKYYGLLKRRNSLLRFVITICRRDKNELKRNVQNKLFLTKNNFLKKNNKNIFFLRNIIFFKKNKIFRRPFFFKKLFKKSLQENRLIWRYFFFLKFKRQFYLTKFLTQTILSPFIKWFISYELTVANILLRSRLCLTRQQANNFIKLGHVFVNGRSVKSTSFSLKSSDVIQLLYKIPFFINWKYMYSVLLKNSFRLGYCLWRLYRNKGNFFKQRSHHVPHWVNKLMFLKLNVPKYMEVDYSCLTLLILRSPSNIFECSIYTVKYFNLFLYRLYNWKYVT